MTINNAINSKQTLDVNSSPQFTGLNLSSLAPFSVSITNGSSNIITDPGFIYSNVSGPALSLISSSGNTFLGLHTSATSGVSSMQMDRQTTSGKSFINFETNAGGDEWWIGLTNIGSHNFFILDQTNVSSPFAIAQGTGLITIASLTASQAVVTNGSSQLASLAYTSANTASTLVERDGSGNFSAGTITAALSGNASTATSATIAVSAANVITTQVSLNASYFPLMVSSSTNSSQVPDLATGLTYNPSTNTLTTTTFSGALSGNASTATTATNATNVATTQVSANASFFPLMAASSTNGNQAADLGTGLTFNPSTNTLATTTFSGALAGNATTATNATNIATLSASTNANFPLIFVASSTNSNQAPELSANLNYNPATVTLNISGGGGINPFLNIGSGSASLIGTTTPLNFSSSLSFGSFVNLGGSGRNIGVKNDGLTFMTYNLDYNATTPGYQYSNSNGACVIELTTNGVFALSTAPSGGTAGAAVSPTVRFQVTNAGLVNIPGLSASSLIQTDGSNNLSANNTLSSTVLGNVTKVTQTILTSATSGTYTTPAHVTHLVVEVTGSGGGGAGCATAATSSGGGSGGGGGGYSKLTITAPLATYAYTIDGGGAGGAAGGNPGVAGGTTTFGTSLISITGGGASLAGVASLNLIAGNYAAGGVASGGDINLSGGVGYPSFILASGASGSGSALGGAGGNSALGGGGAPGRRTQGNGNVGAQPGGGGGGGCVINGGASAAGGNGGAGMIVITEYYVG